MALPSVKAASHLLEQEASHAPDLQHEYAQEQQRGEDQESAHQRVRLRVEDLGGVEDVRGQQEKEEVDLCELMQSRIRAMNVRVAEHQQPKVGLQPKDDTSTATAAVP